MTVSHSALRALRVILLCIGASGAGLIVYDWGRPGRIYANTSLRPLSDSGAPPPARAAQTTPTRTREDFTEMLARPLFREQRRPQAAGAARQSTRPQVAEQDLSTRIALSAVVINDDEKIALIEHKDNGKLQKLRLGEDVYGWTLTSIQERSIFLGREGRGSRIALVFRSVPVATPPPEPVSVEGAEEATTANPPAADG